MAKEAHHYIIGKKILVKYGHLWTKVYHQR